MGAEYEAVYPGGQAPVLFDGGLNNKFEKTLILDNESPDCLNVVFTNGAATTYGGTTKLSTAAVGSFVCDGLYTRRSDDSSETMIAFNGGTARYLAGTSFHTIPSALSVFTAGIRVAATQYRANIFIGNGGVNPYKYNGTDFTLHGVYPPTNTISAVCAGAGNIQSGSVSYKMTGINSYSAESDLSSTAISLTVTASCTIGLSSVPVAPQSWGVASRRIYRYGPSNTTYVLITTLADNTTTTYSDNTQAGTSSAPTDNGVPPKYSICIYHDNRLFVNDAANPNYVWYSSLGEPFTFPSTNFFKIGDRASDLVKGFEIDDNGLLVNCENSQWINYMTSTDDTTWRQIRVASNFGCKSPFGTWRYNSMIGFPAFQNTKFSGFASISGASSAPSATFLTVSASGSELTSDKIEPDMFNVQEAYAGNISSFVFKNSAYIAATYGTSQTTNNRVYIFDFSRTNLSPKQKFSWAPLDGINAAQFTVYAGFLYYGSSIADGFFYKMDASTYANNGSAINSYLYTKEFSGLPQHQNLPKDFRKVKFLADLGGAFYMGLTWKVDSDKGVGQSTQLSLNPGSSLWGTMRWGIDTWGGGKYQYEFEIPLGQTQGKRIQFKFDNKNTAGSYFKIHRMTFTYNVRGNT